MDDDALDDVFLHDGYVESFLTQEVVGKFESCEYGLEEFTHARHLTVACWYLCICPREEALARMRAGLRRFIAHHRKEGYHETITRFWMELLDGYLGGLPADMPLDAKVKTAVARYGRKDVLFAYYTRERVMSDAARREWMEPDLRSLDDESHRRSSPEEFLQLITSLFDG